MSSDYAITVKNVSKIYHLYNKPVDRLKESFLGRGRFSKEVVALHSVNLNIPKGATVGLIGQNGSGKSTLLQIISGILTPSSGEVFVNGKIAALLELGSGFNPEFTGRENVIMNGTIMGLTHDEILEKMPSIEEFAEIGHFIDQPVKTYSSGMFLRLAFATAIHTDPDILIVDEALAVGDTRFQNKCYRKFKEFQEKGKTILFVTHTTDLLVRHCDYAFLLNKGELIMEGKPRDVVNKYLDILYGKNNTVLQQIDADNEQTKEALFEKYPDLPSKVVNFLLQKNDKDNCTSRRSYNSAEYRWGNKNAEIMDYLIVSNEQYDHVEYNSFDRMDVYVKVKFNKSVKRPIFGLTIKTTDGVTVYGTNSRDVDCKIGEKLENQWTVVKFSFIPRLVQGDYFISLGVAEEQTNQEIIPLDRRYDMIHIKFFHNSLGFGIVDLEMNVVEVR
jgi:lipopolysaccharide transport system ATP-binding protein